MKRFHTRWKHKNIHKRTKTKKAVLNALKKHLRRRKPFIRLFAFLCFLCALCAFLCVKQTRQHFYSHKTSKRKKIACMTFCAFCAFYAQKKHLSEIRLFMFCAFCACEIFSFKKYNCPDTLIYITTKNSSYY